MQVTVSESVCATPNLKASLCICSENMKTWTWRFTARFTTIVEEVKSNCSLCALPYRCDVTCVYVSTHLAFARVSFLEFRLGWPFHCTFLCQRWVQWNTPEVLPCRVCIAMNCGLLNQVQFKSAAQMVSLEVCKCGEVQIFVSSHRKCCFNVCV